MCRLSIDGHNVEVESGATILDAARRLGIGIPTMCHMDGCSPSTWCMVCVVKVKGIGKLVPACGSIAEEGMVVETTGTEVRAARRTALELLLGDHVGDCIAPCHSACPAHLDIPKMIREIAAGRYRDAIITVKEHIALPASLGRICPEICEKACRRSAVDAAVSICLLKRFAADVDLASAEPYEPDCKPPSGKRVAIAGAGPAGLAAAYYLRQAGHERVVYDDHPQPGGNLRYALDEDRLPRAVLDAEIGLIARLGVEFRLETHVDSIAEVRREYDAVLVATGKSNSETMFRLGLQTSTHGLHVEGMMTSAHGRVCRRVGYYPVKCGRARGSRWPVRGAGDQPFLCRGESSRGCETLFGSHRETRGG